MKMQIKITHVMNRAKMILTILRMMMCQWQSI